MSEPWSIIVHGGAKTIAPALAEAHRRGCLAAVAAGQALLEAGGSAVEAVVAAVRALEDDPTFNAGYGSVLNADGKVETDCALMDGATLDVGAVAALRGVKNPIELARVMLRDRPCLLVGEGAYRYAQERGALLVDPSALIAPKPAEPCDTVGCVAFDQGGDLAAGTSTGGLKGVRPGRVGDSPLPGCGLYAENGVGGVSLSGDGESILRLTLAARIIHALHGSGGDEACRRGVDQMQRVGGEAGCILLDARGQASFAHNSQHFAVALARQGQPARAYLTAEERAHD